MNPVEFSKKVSKEYYKVLQSKTYKNKIKALRIYGIGDFLHNGYRGDGVCHPGDQPQKSSGERAVLDRHHG